MKKILLYGMTGEKMCFQHNLMNALDMAEAGMEVRLIFEGASVKLVPIFEEEKNPLYLKAKSKGLIAGICFACSKVLGVYDQVKDYGIPLLQDMNGHAGMKDYITAAYDVISI